MSITSTLLNNENTRNFIFRDKSILLKDGKLPDAPTLGLCLQLDAASDWLSEPEMSMSALELEGGAPNPKGCEDIPLREFFHRCHESGDGELGALAARAKGLLNFKASKRFCSVCGGNLHDDDKFTARTCGKCGRQFFPQIEPAIIVLVSRGDEYLLAKHAQRNTDVWTTLAGFVELGETIEDAVHREIFEETGIRVKNLRYVASQAWPFPDQLMLAFRAEYESGEIRVQESEIKAARWFRKDYLPAIPPAGSVAHNLITGVFG